MTNAEIKFVRGWMETYEQGVYVHDLCRECLVELKQAYMVGLANEGAYSEVMNVDYDEPSMLDLVEADELIPDDIVFTYFEGISFIPDDFFCLMETEE